MKRIERRLKEYRSNSAKRLVDGHSKNMSEKDKLKIYPNWVKVMNDNGETQMAKELQKEIDEIKHRQAQKLNIFQNIKNWFKKITKKGS